MTIEARSSADSDRRAIVVTPRQAAVGTFLGGPVALMYFMRKNYLAIGDRSASKKVLWVGSLLLLLWNAVFSLDVLLTKAPSIALDSILRATPLILVIVARQLAQQQVKLFPHQYEVCSNWSVVGSAILCLLASIGCLLPAVIVVSTCAYLGLN